MVTVMLRTAISSRAIYLITDLLTLANWVLISNLKALIRPWEVLNTVKPQLILTLLGFLRVRHNMLFSESQRCWKLDFIPFGKVFPVFISEMNHYY